MINYYHKLIYLLPAALITGPFLPDSIIVICVLLFLVDTFKKKLFEYYNNNFFKYFLLFLIIINLSSLFSENLESLKYSLGYLRYGIFSIFIFYLLKNIKNFKLNFSYAIVFTFLLLIIDGLIQLICGKNILLFELQTYKTNLPYVTSFFGDEKKLGSYLARLTPLFLTSLIILSEIYKSKKKYLFLFSSIILLNYMTVIFSTERVSIFIITVYLFFIFSKSNFFFKPKVNWLLFMIFFILILLYLHPLLFQKLKSTFYSIGLMTPGINLNGDIIGGYEKGIFIFSKFHQDQIIASISAFKDNIFLGIGAKNFKYFYNAWHPHNFHFQILAEAGIFAYLILFFLFFIIIFKISKLLFKKDINTNDEIKLVLLLSFFCSMIPIPSGDVFNNWLNILVYFPVGFYLYYNEQKT